MSIRKPGAISKPRVMLNSSSAPNSTRAPARRSSGRAGRPGAARVGTPRCDGQQRGVLGQLEEQIDPRIPGTASPA